MSCSDTSGASTSAVRGAQPADEAAAREYRRGLGFAAAAYAIWSANPLYFALLKGVPALEVTAHRAWWSVPALLGLLALRGDLWRSLATLANVRLLGWLLLSTLFIGANWWLFIHGLQTGRTLEMSLGYYIYPLLSVLAGLLLGERFTPRQALSIGLMALAVAWLTWASGAFPWLALALGGSFSIYGLLRRHIAVGALEGLLVEATLLSAAFAAWAATSGAALHFGADAWNTTFLLLAGPVTLAPLAFYAAAARRIRFSTLGLMFYVIPTSFFITGWLVFGEPFDVNRLIAFVIIWTALALYASETPKRGTASAA